MRVKLTARETSKCGSILNRYADAISAAVRRLFGAQVTFDGQAGTVARASRRTETFFVGDFAFRPHTDDHVGDIGVAVSRPIEPRAS